MALIDKEQIRAEIERLKNQLIRGACAAQIEMETNCKDEAYNEVLAFLDTLPEQPVKGLEEEIENYYGRMPDDTDKIESARHFAEWGAKQAKSKD